MAETINFRVRVSDEGSFKKVEVNAEDLKNAIGAVKAETERLNSSLVNWAQASQAVAIVQQSMGELKGVLDGLLESYAAQEVAETKLANNMRNTMDAREEDIEAIKELTAAQQALGVIGDEVQLAGAQELATYLEKKSSLEKLIPVMNDMLAQQYGLEASQESAAQVASMLGKVMEGQTAALSRYGYSFDEAQEQILKFGTEEERAAVLAEVVEGSVGGMNEALRQTSAGRIQALNNWFGDLKEMVGDATKYVSLFVGGVASIAESVTGVLKFASSFRSLREAIRSANLAAISLRGSLRGLLIASGVGVAIVALGAAIEYFVNKTTDAKEATEQMSAADEAFKSKFAEAETAIRQRAEELDALISAKKDTREAVKQLAEEYPSLVNAQMGAAEAYDALVNGSKQYCTQLALEAKASSLKAQMAELAAQREINAAKMRKLEAEGKRERETWGIGSEIGANGKRQVAIVRKTEFTADYQALIDANQAIDGQTKQLEADLDDVNNAVVRVKTTVTEGGEAGIQVLRVAEMNLQEVNNALAANEQKGLTLTDPTELAKLAASNEALRRRKKELEALQGLGTKNSKGAGNQQLVADPKGLEELRTNIELTTKKLTDADTEEQRMLRRQIVEWKKKADAIELAQKKAMLPEGTLDGNRLDTSKLRTEADVKGVMQYLGALKNVANTKEKIAEIDRQTAAAELRLAELQRPEEGALDRLMANGASSLELMQAIDRELNYQRALRKTAAAEEQQQIDDKIGRLETLQQYSEHAGVIGMDNSALRSYDQLDIKLNYYRTLVNQVATESRPAILRHIKDLEDIRARWEAADKAATTETDISRLNTLKELGDAIGYLQTKQQEASGEEIQQIQQEIDKLEEKQSALKLNADMSAMQREVGELTGLSGTEYRIRISAIGLDGLLDKIRELNKLLQNPNLTAEQRKQLEGLRGAYQKMAKDSVSNLGTYRKGWDGVKGIGNSVESITSAVEGNGNAWQKVQGVIDGTLGVYDGVKEVISLVRMLTMATNQESTAEMLGATAKQGKALASTNVVSEGALEATTNSTVAATSGTEAAADATGAAAKVMKAHAWIPWVGVALGAGMVGLMLASISKVKSSVPKFADGGLAYGPTLGIFGEYAGAARNPEVVAPLDKLRALIDTDNGTPGKVTFRIKGRALEGVLKKEGVRHARS